MKKEDWGSSEMILDLKFTHKARVSLAVTTMSIMLLLLLSSSLSSSSAANAITSSKQVANTVTPDDLWLRRTAIAKMGAYVPDGMQLENNMGGNQTSLIIDYLSQGFNEYYFVMTSFNDTKQTNQTEMLLAASDKTALKVIVILLPPSEGGPDGNYDWAGWIDYFNTLKAQHPSLRGFAIDDFNWISTRKDTKFWRNIDFMLDSDLLGALEQKRADLNFYPVVYFEGLRTDVVIKQFTKFSDTIILVSAGYYNVSGLESNLTDFKEKFSGKSINYIVYPVITYNYTKHGYSSPSDRLVMATLSIASRIADGIIIWHKIDSPVVQDFLRHRQDAEYLQAIRVMEKLQIEDEHE